MKLLVFLIITVGLAHGQGGFFSNVRNALFGARPQRLPPQQQQQFAQQPNQQQQFGQQPPQQPFPPQQVPQVQPPVNQPGQFQQQQPARPVPPTANVPAGRGRGDVNGCPVVDPNHFWNGEGFIVTWLINGDGKQDNVEDPCQKFTAEEAEKYCALAGGHAVSLDSNERAEHFMDQARQYAKRFFWTGGRINHAGEVVIWPSGKTEGIGSPGTRFWSHTGGAEPPRAQPDNRDQNEVCLAVLNNFYADGIKWHDVACHHKKPTMCEFGAPRVH